LSIRLLLSLLVLLAVAVLFVHGAVILLVSLLWLILLPLLSLDWRLSFCFFRFMSFCWLLLILLLCLLHYGRLLRDSCEYSR
jgi:hypothetical protein